MSTSNPNGHIALVVTYSGTTMKSYSDFLSKFYVTLPGGCGVAIGADQYLGGSSGTSLQAGKSYPLSSATATLADYLPTNTGTATQKQNLTEALQTWASTQSASTGNTKFAGLYLSNFTGGRIFFSSANLGLGAANEPVPASPGDPAYDSVYAIVEPYIAAQIGNPTIPGNLADITDIDWFSYPISVKVWSFDFADATCVTLSKHNEQKGGDGTAINSALDVNEHSGQTTNQYPSIAHPTTGGSAVARRLCGPTTAAASNYYSNPKTDSFPYHYFDDYLNYAVKKQGTAVSSFTLTGKFSGVGKNPTEDRMKAQSFSFDVDFSGIKTTKFNYSDGSSATKIATDSKITFNGYTDYFGSAQSPISINIPWAEGNALYEIQVSDTKDAISAGWMTLSTSPDTIGSGTYSPADSIVKASGTVLPSSAGLTLLKLTYSLNKVLGTTDDLYQNGSGTIVEVSGNTGLTLTANAVYSSADNPLTIVADSSGNISSIKINDFGAPPNFAVANGTAWTIPSGATGLGNNQAFTIRVKTAPALRQVLIINSGEYADTPTDISVTVGGQDVSFTVDSSGSKQAQWSIDPSWVTLSQPAGIYGANTGYTVVNGSTTTQYKSLVNDVFGWAVADLLAALNAGFVCSPESYKGKVIGETPSQWFLIGDNPYTGGVWGAKAWASVAGTSNFWNTWAYNLNGLTDAYGFAFTDRFASGILTDFNPPAANPTKASPVLVEIIVGDSPYLDSAV